MGKSKTSGGINGDRARGLAAYRHTLEGKKGPPGVSEAAAGSADLAAGKSRGRSQQGLFPEAEPGLIKTGAPGSAPVSGGDSKYRRAAKFLILIGGDEAAAILSQLDAEQVEAVSKEIASVRGITAAEAESILGEFRSLLSASYNYSGSASGGVEAARRLLYAAFGPEKGESFLNRTLPGTRENGFAFLEDFSGEQVALLLKEESPPAAALILSRLSPKLSAAVLANIPPDRKPDIIRRIARLDRIAEDVLDRIAGALREKARHIAGSAGAVEIDGRNALAAILRSSDISFGDRILDELEEGDPDLGRDLKERLHTLEDVINAEDRPLQEKLRSMSERDIVLLLKGRSGGFAEKILANVSAQRRALIREEEAVLGPVSKKEADGAARDFLAWFRLSREEGRILMLDDEDVVR
jgi:flagellar motor switch protein FliG